jgi:hypothetical protein
MKTLQECKNQVAKEKAFSDWKDLLKYQFINLIDRDYNEASKLYAKEVAQQALIDAAENLEPNNCYYNGSHCDLDAHRKEILNTHIKLL